MSKDISKGSKELVIVSNTSFFKINGELGVLEAPLREVEMLTHIFSKIRWIGFLEKDENVKDARLPNTDKIELMPLKTSGGDTLKAKLEVISKLPYYIKEINRGLKGFQYVHTRGPATPAMIAIIKSLFDPKRKYWHKYAGNWNQQNPPISYGSQIEVLKRARNTFVAVNGKWSDQEEHVHSFVNPCFNNVELEEARRIKSNKNYDEDLTLCFVGRVYEQKGVGKILQALPKMKNKFKTVYIAGGGGDLERFKEQAKSINENVIFTGKLPRKELNNIYEKSHILCLPTWVSEGFPKVIAEAASYGCVPVVSSVSSIAQYIRNDVHGIVLQNLEPQHIADELDSLFENRKKLKRYSTSLDNLIDSFTYEHYNERILKEFVNQ